MVRNSTIANNHEGLVALNTGATIRVTRSTITGNTSIAWSAPPGSNNVVLSYGDNNIDGNGGGNFEPPNPLLYH